MGDLPSVLARRTAPDAVHPDGSIENLGRSDEDVHPRLEGPAALRARLLLRDDLGDIDNARDVLTRLIAVLDNLDETDGDAPEAAEP